MGGWNEPHPGDGASLAPYSRTQVANRTVLGLTYAGHAWAVDYDFFEWDDRVSLYRDGERTAVAKQPAAFPVPGGRIEFATTWFGVRRAHLVPAAGPEQPLSPHPKTLEAGRQRLAQRHPVMSAVLATAAVAVLLVGLVVAVCGVVDTLTHTELAGDRLGWAFDSPFDLDGEATTVLTVAGILAIVERALSMRHHWLLDADTWWMS